MPEYYGVAALRHFGDAEQLAAVESWDGAGHLIGFSAECSIKHGIGSLRPDTDSVRKHIPELVDIAKRLLSQRRQAGIYIVLKSSDFMSGWTVESRYSDTGLVSKETYMLWRKHAYSLLHAANLRSRR